ncbi:TolC family protein [Chryseolinea sp. H1M3-3]|uniref:TolC family protein n=1 Tax=Chryseolinea sp. H1M3-3 TaxID=3034144 RepID=UPI0023ECD1D9|nr:TolC family protein [Chryseolinea sp. H1M3-3]
MSFYIVKLKFIFWISLLLVVPSWAQSQHAADSLLQAATLDKVVLYALDHQPAVQQAIVDEEIANKVIKGKLADWYPQINFSYNYQRFFDLQSSVIDGRVIRFGVNNSSSTQFNATQNIFNRDALLASSTASKVRILANQNTSRSKIDIVVDVTKAFYDVLATAQQVKVSDQSITRLEKSLQSAYSRYTSGVADKTDYKRATILLGNAKAERKANSEALIYKKQLLKSLMGYPLQHDLPIEYDTVQMEQEAMMDTLQQINYTEHIEYKILFTQRELQQANVKYSYWGFLPSLNAFGAYILNFQNDNFGELYNQKYPYSYVGATLTFPIFQGGKRTARIQEEKWRRTRLDWSLIDLRNNLNAEYARALASYKSNLAAYQTQKENVALAEEVYDVIQLQYQNGIRAYLDVTIAEADLRTTRINYFNALYQVLASKMDVQRALGQINY